MRRRTQGVSRVMLGARCTGRAAPGSELSTCSAPVPPSLSSRFTGPQWPQPTLTDKLHLQSKRKCGRPEQLCLHLPAPTPVDPSFSSASTHHSVPQPSPSHRQVLREPSGCWCTGDRAHSPALAGTARPSLPAAAPRPDTPVSEPCPHTKTCQRDCQGDGDGKRMLPEPGFKPA